jgi:hypothetical protein
MIFILLCLTLYNKNLDANNKLATNHIKKQFVLEDEVIHAKSYSEPPGINFLSINQQNALNSFTPDQKSIAKSLINKLLLENNLLPKDDNEKPNNQRF